MSDGPSGIPAWPDIETSSTGLVRPLDQVVADLAREDGPADLRGDWPEALWRVVHESGATKWSMPASLGGAECDRVSLNERFARLAEGSLTAAFILTQHDGGVRRMLNALDRPRVRQWLERIAAGEAFTTVGISHLTTSRRYDTQALRATARSDGSYQLDGMIPWVTAACRAQVIVVGAGTGDGQQLLVALPTDKTGVSVRPAFELAALQASCTTEICCEGVVVEADDILAGPAPDVLSSTPGAAGTGGLETSALALGQARAALVRMHEEASTRPEVAEPLGALDLAWSQLARDFFCAARGEPNALPAATIRAQANALALRLTQAYLTARKGTGFLRAEPASRWARQALFFLVWSCPTPVAAAALRELAGLCPG